MLRFSQSQRPFFSDHTRLLALALPMILANITTPLLGLVDTAVLGHMIEPAMLAGASVAALILTQIYWVCGFLRMSSTGLSAQAKGNENATYESAKVLWQTLSVAALLGVVVVVLQSPILHLGLALTEPNASVATHLKDYFGVRVWGAPAVMLNFALIGWLVGQHKTRSVMTIQVIGNLLNAGLDVVFVFGLGFSVAGVALASIIAEYTMFVMSIAIAFKRIGCIGVAKDWFNRAARKVLLKLNGDMFMRNLALQACLAFLTIQGARYGEVPAAVNAILMQFFVMIALGLDGIASGVEALVGEAKGANDQQEIKRRTHQGLLWSTVFALFYSTLFFVAGKHIVTLLTQHTPIIDAALPYIPLMVLLPLMGHWCFLYDGVFVGLTQGSEMRNTMIISALVVFFPVWFFTQSLGNMSLWCALLAFLLSRGITLAWAFYRMDKQTSLPA